MLRGVVISIKHLTAVWCMRPAAAWRRSGEKNCCSQRIDIRIQKLASHDKTVSSSAVYISAHE